MPLTKSHKERVVDFIMGFEAKAIFETYDDMSTAYESGEISKEEIYDFVDELAELCRSKIK